MAYRVDNGLLTFKSLPAVAAFIRSGKYSADVSVVRTDGRALHSWERDDLERELVKVGVRKPGPTDKSIRDVADALRERGDDATASRVLALRFEVRA